MSKAPYLHSDGSDCYTKDCSLGNTSIHAPAKSSFAQALAAKSLTRPVEVTYDDEEEDDDDWEEEEDDGCDEDGFLEEGVLGFLCNEGTGEGTPKVRSFLIANGVTERNGWSAAKGQWIDNSDGDYSFGDTGHEITIGEDEWYQGNPITVTELRTYELVNEKTGQTLSLYGTEGWRHPHGGAAFPETTKFITYINLGEAIYATWEGAGGASDGFKMFLWEPHLIEAIKFNPNPTFIRWAAANYSSSEVSNAIHTELLKMFPGSEDVPLEWLLKMMD